MATENSVVDNLINVQIPTWNQQFGQQSFCDCDECDLMTGGPAYVAHCLSYFESCKRNDNLIIPDLHNPAKLLGETPYDVLIKRAPYLPHIPLTCENMNTEVPYIKVATNIVAFFAANKTLDKIPSYGVSDTDKFSDSTTAAYKILSEQCYPFTLPYHQPLEMIRTYLTKLKTSRYELLQIFRKLDNEAKLILLQEYLKLSSEEYLLLADFKINNVVLNVFELFGFKTAADFQSKIYDVPVVLEHTGLLYAELIDMFKSRFVNPGSIALGVVEKLFAGSQGREVALFSKLKEIRDAKIDATFEADLKIRIQTLLKSSANPDLNPKEFKNWLDQNFNSFQATLIVIPDRNDVCNFQNAEIGTVQSLIDNTLSHRISDESFKRVYQFVRLYKKTGLKVKELDQLLFPMTTKTNAEVLASLPPLLEIIRRLKLTSAQVSTLYSNIETHGSTSIYNSLFLNRKDVAFKPFEADAFGNYFSADVPLKKDGKFNEVLLTALQISSQDLDSIVSHLGLPDAEKVNLSIENISVIYSYVLLSAATVLSVEQLLKLTAASNKTDALRTFDKVTTKFKDANLDVTLSLIDIINQVKSSSFSIEELLSALGKIPVDDLTYQSLSDKFKQSLFSFKVARDSINHEHGVPKPEEIEEKFVYHKLLLLYPKEVVDQFMGMMTGKIVFGVTLVAKPELQIPQQLAAKVKYDKGTGRLEVTGVLSLAEWTLIPENDALKTALQNIFALPDTFLKNNFSKFLPAVADRNELLDRLVGGNSLSLSNKLSNTYSKYRPALVQQLTEKAMTEQISSLIGLNDNLTVEVSKRSMADIMKLSEKILEDVAPEVPELPQLELKELISKLLPIWRASQVVLKFGLTKEELAYFNAAAEFSTIDPGNLSFDQWIRLGNYRKLTKYATTSQGSFIEIFKRAASNETLSSVIAAVSSLTGWKVSQVAAAVDFYKFGLPDFTSEMTLIKLAEMVQLAGKVSVGIEMLAKWANRATDFGSLYTLANEIKQTILSQYDETVRKETEGSIESSLWENQRNALVDYALILDVTKATGIRSVEELSSYLLIELPINSGMMTTPMRQAMSTMQSFANQSISGLLSIRAGDKEFGVAKDAIDAKVWEPKAFFRTWQVSMEFLTNPYPYLSYKYLIDKSESAKNLEETLLKSDITQRNVEYGYYEYLQYSCETANLEIVASHLEDADFDAASDRKIVHVVGKCRSAPYSYFLCTKNGQDQWSFWEKIPIAIKVNDGDSSVPSGAHVIFTKFSGRYFLFLPEFIKRQKQQSLGVVTTFNDMATKSVANASPIEYWEIKLAVSEYFQGKWSAKKYLKIEDNLSRFEILTQPTIAKYLFNTSLGKNHNGSDALILSLSHFGKSDVTNFTISSVNSSVIVSAGNPLPAKQAESPVENYFYQNLTLKSLKFPVAGAVQSPAILNENSADKLINFSPQLNAELVDIYQQPFFFHDKERSYYVTSAPIKYTVQEDRPTTKIIREVLEPAKIIRQIREPEPSEFLAMNFLIRS